MFLDPPAARSQHTPRNPGGVPIGRGLSRRWFLRHPAPSSTAPEPQRASLVRRVLLARGLSDPRDIAAFAHPSLLQLHDPGLLPGIDAAVERLLAALGRREPIVIYGDYDVDGVTATAILVHTLRALSPDADIRTFIPHRDEGYGLSADALLRLAAEGARVAVSVDCGITAHQPALAARGAGLDLIITDHHNLPPPGQPLPDAVALVHPRLPGSRYPFAGLSGAGVAYKLAWRLLSAAAGGHRVPKDHRQLLVELLAPAALGCIADAAPLTDENRVLARFGLARILHSPFIGLGALAQASGLVSARVDEEQVGFQLAPRLNACGRLGHARAALELLLTTDPARAAGIAAELSRLNNDRRNTERRILADAADRALSAGMTTPDRRAIVLASPDWHPGVIGIVAQRLVDRFARPVILLCQLDGKCKGSARSVPGFSLYEALRACADELISFGGHDAAAGLALAPDRLAAFTERFTAAANAALSPDDLFPALTIDADADIAELSPDAVADLATLAPFGQGNPRPRLRLPAVELAAPPQPFGSQARHVNVILRGPSGLIRCVGWNWATHIAAIPRRGPIDAVVTPKLSDWNGGRSVEPELLDLRSAQSPS